ncbi:MAG TPA: DUF4136 domain-containing protein [Anaeromyxobacteraceae bacterium]|nr:DUF4136 domain-containing protein [Anaeromyxobacteraceae bacterium]
MRLAPAVALAAVLASACATVPSPGTPVIVDASANFAAYQTFDFLPVPAGVPAVTPSLAYFGVDGVLARDLGTVGLARAIGGTPDLYFAYFAGGTPVDTQAWGYTTAGATPIAIADVPPTSLVVDAVDARSMKLVWRGVAQGALVSPASVDPAIRQMLTLWPTPARN